MLAAIETNVLLAEILDCLKEIKVSLAQEHVITVDAIGEPINWQALHNMLDDGK